MLGVTIAAGVCGALISTFGSYWPFLVFGPIFSCIGSGLLYTVDEHTSSAKLIGFQIVRPLSPSQRWARADEQRDEQILAIGVGAVLQNTIIAVQADCDDETEVPQKTALVTFAQLGTLPPPLIAREVELMERMKRSRRHDRYRHRLVHLRHQARLEPARVCARSALPARP